MLRHRDKPGPLARPKPRDVRSLLWVGGLDVGMSRTTAAYARNSLNAEGLSRPDIYLPPHQGRGVLGDKELTALLLRNEPGYPLEAAGYAAEDLYRTGDDWCLIGSSGNDSDAHSDGYGTDTEAEEEQVQGGGAVERREATGKYLFFNEFKKYLVPGGPRLPYEELMCPSHCGTVEVPLLLLFQRTLEHHGGKVLRDINKRLQVDDGETVGEGQEQLTPHDVLWCLTVPAGWDGYAMGFMRHAAWKAGLIPEETSAALRFCTEPEAAFLDAATTDLALLGFKGQGVLNADGGACTYDVTVHRMESSHPLRLPEMAERQMTIEGGSRLIEGHFETWFLRVFLGLDEENEADNRVATSLARTPEWLMMMREFEEQKISFNDPKNQSFRLQAFGNLLPRLTELLTPDRLKARMSNMPKHASLGRIGRGALKLQRELMASFFEPVACVAAAFVKTQHDRVGGSEACPVINLSGGFGCSDVLFSFIRDEVGPGARVVKVGRPDLAVVRGAVIHALTQPVMTRVLTQSYGVLITHPYTPTNADHCRLAENPANIEMLNGVRHVRQFKSLVTRGQEVDVAERIDVGDYWPTSLDKWEATFQFFVNDLEEPPLEVGASNAVARITFDLDRTISVVDQHKFKVHLEFDEVEVRACITYRGTERHVPLCYEP